MFALYVYNECPREGRFLKRTIVFLLFSVAAAALPVIAQPTISPGGVTNIASLAPDGLRNSGIAAGSIFVVNGTGLGAPNPTPINLFQNATYPLPTGAGLNGTTVQLLAAPGQALVGGHSLVPCIVLYESPTMVAAIVPSSTQPLAYTVSVTYNGQTSAQSGTVHVVPTAFGQFTYGQAFGSPGTGNGPGPIQQQNSSGSFVVNLFDAPAVAGQTILLYGTGLGAVNGDESQGPTNGAVVGLNALNFTVYIGGKIATFEVGQDYIGRFISNGQAYAGVDIIEVQIPQGVQGCYVPVAVVVGGVTSNITTMAIDPSGTFCNDPMIGYSQADLQQVVTDQAARFGTVSVSNLSLLEPNGSIGRSDAISASFVNMTPTQFHSSPGAGPSAGGCTVILVGPNSQPQVLGTPIDAGSAISLSGPDGSQQIAQAAGQLTYTNLTSSTSPMVDPGGFSIGNGGGGADVGAFQGSFTVPAAPQGIQGGGSTIPTNSNLVLAWSSADPNSLVEVLGLSADANTGLAAAFQCTAPASANVIQIPSYVLSWLPTTNSSVGLLSVLTIGLGRFQAPGLEAGYFSYTVGDGAAVQYTAGATNVKE